MDAVRRQLRAATIGFCTILAFLVLGTLVATAMNRYDVATLTAALLAAALAGAQIFIAFRQTRLMEKQDEILVRRASLEAFGHSVSDPNAFGQFEQKFSSAHQGASGLTMQIYVINCGLRAANGFTLSARTRLAPTLRPKSPDWTRHTLMNESLFILESEQRIFPGDACIVQPLALILPGATASPAVNEVRVAYEDGETGWLPLRDFSEMPLQFRERLAGPIIS